MSKHQLDRALAAIHYTDYTDFVALRYLLLHALAFMADRYRNAYGHRCAIDLLTQHRKLEGIADEIREKCRGTAGTRTDFEKMKIAALQCIERCEVAAFFVSAA